jgi:hypothetical protein
MMYRLAVTGIGNHEGQRFDVFLTIEYNVADVGSNPESQINEIIQGFIDQFTATNIRVAKMRIG